ncbi:hypothetical protein G6F56_009070 [Rhizopus delemar]|nr:hypothetical protein G6F56_009070 [Rhizopus delemar]
MSNTDSPIVTIQVKTPRNWSCEEDIQLCRSWINISADSVHGTDQLIEKIENRNESGSNSERMKRFLEPKLKPVTVSTPVRRHVVDNSSEEEEGNEEEARPIGHKRARIHRDTPNHRARNSHCQRIEEEGAGHEGVDNGHVDLSK